MNRNGKKSFDCVEMVRGIRDRISEEMRTLTAEEQISWVRSTKLSDPGLERLRKKAAHHGVAPDARSGATRPARVPAARKERSHRRG